jgi:hypothetical protein
MCRFGCRPLRSFVAYGTLRLDPGPTWLELKIGFCLRVYTRFNMDSKECCHRGSWLWHRAVDGAGGSGRPWSALETAPEGVRGIDPKAQLKRQAKPRHPNGP